MRLAMTGRRKRVLALGALVLVVAVGAFLLGRGGAERTGDVRTTGKATGSSDRVMGDDGSVLETTTDEADPTREEVALVAEPTQRTVVASRGSTSTLEFVTRPRSNCQMEVQRGSAVEQRLPPATADDNGKVRWKWTVAKDGPVGAARAVVVCSGGASGEVQLTIIA